LIWLDNELSLFKQNIEILRVNQRIGRLAFLWAVLGLMCSKFLAYFLIVVLEEFVHDVSFQGSTYLSYIYFGSLQIIHIVVTIFLLKRRLNDCGSSLWYMILVPIAYLSLWVYWGMSFSWESISETFINASFYWDGFFWQYFILACFALPLSVPDSNKYGLDEGRDRYNNYIISYARSSTISKDKKAGTLDYVCSCIWEVLFAKLFDVKGRTSISAFGVGLVGTRIFMDIIMNMAIAVVSLIVQCGIPLYIPRWGFMAILIWPALAMITLGIRRLHDSLLSGLWIIGLCIPYINIFVSYHLLLKKSWHIES
jgi:putative membrane protein